MELLTLIFGEAAPTLAAISRYIVPLLCVLIVVRCVRSMLRERYEPETWAYLYLPGEIMVPLRHWECILGSARSVDGQLHDSSVERLHACLARSATGEWTVYNLGRGDTFVNGQRVTAGGMPIADADVITLGKASARFVDLTEEERASLLKYRHAPGRQVRPGGTLLLLSMVQILLVLQQFVYNDAAGFGVFAAFAVLFAIEWVYFCILFATGQTGFEPETLGFFLTTIGLSVAASSVPGTASMFRQIAFMLAGIVLFLVLGIWIRDLKRTKSLNIMAAGAALVLLVLNLVLAEVTNGAQNWVSIGGFSFQPSEFVKVLYIYAGAATLDRLFERKTLLFYIGFSAACVGAMALMGDFGAALIFFVTFLVISFMRSGSFATLFLAIGGAVLAVMVVLSAKPYVMNRFATWGHVWEDVYDTGYQQARAMCAAASGGLFGQGSGNGWLVDVTAGDTDMVFGVVCEELGLITGLCCVASILVLACFVVKNAAAGRSSYFVIAGAAAVTTMMGQMALNVFGAMDILPFTGVTFPFVSRGGSSLICCWMLLAFVKGCDMRARGSFAVKRPEKFSGGVGVEEPDTGYDDYDRHDTRPQPQWYREGNP